MTISSPFIKRPIGTSLIALGIAIAGVVAFVLLPVAPLPQIDFPTISVQGSLPGASAVIMATSVAAPLERQLGRIAGITQMTSSSSLGSSQIVLQFDLSRNIDGAARDVQAAINAARSNLPANLPNNPTYRKVNPADAPILIMALTSDKYTPGQLYDAASTILQQKLAQVSGVGQVFVGGGSLPAVRIEIDPTTLSKYGIGLPEVATVLRAANANLAKGQITVGDSYSSVVTNDQIFKAYQYRPLIIAYRNGNPVRIGDIAEVNDSVEDIRNAGLANGKPAVMLVVFKQPGANVIETIDRIQTMLPQLDASIPAEMQLRVMMDRTSTIRTSLHDVEVTLLISMLLVIIVTYLFLGNLRAMIIPGVAVPLSLLGTFAIMLLCGYSLNNLSLMALTISTGFVVDDAVVVLENITRHVEAGMHPIEAAKRGAREVSFTVVSMTLSLIAVFIPILLMGGIVGRLFREFSVTLSVAILVSMFVSLTITPMMCALFLRHQTGDENNIYINFINRIRDRYSRSLDWALAHAGLMLVIMFLTIILNIILFIVIPKGFFPQQDTGRISGSIQAEQNISFQGMRKILNNYISVIKADPAIENVVGFVGGTTVNSGQVFITLKDLKIRHLSADEVINRLRPQLAALTGATMYLQSAQDIMIGGRQGNVQFQYTLSADTLSELSTLVPIITHKLAALPGIADVNSDQRDHGLQVMVNVDHDTALRFGINSKLIDQTLYNAFGQSQVSTMYTAMNQYRVVMEVAPKYWQSPETLAQIYVKSPAGNMVPLSAFASFAPSSTLLLVTHQAQAPSATLSFNLLPGTALGDAVTRVENTIKAMNLPNSITGAFQGTAQAFQESLANEAMLIAAALLAVYVVLGMLYESLIHPITILSTLPSAGVGALLALMISGTDFSIIALIGIILLIGIVKKNAIMMIDFALHAERTENKSTRDAIHEAAILRFRPIMMTTMAALFGAIPLIIGFGLGSELRRPLGIAIVGGLIVSQMLTLYTTPVIYLYLDSLQLRLKTWRLLNWLPRRISHEDI
jgi:multidrug efflux pump